MSVEYFYACLTNEHFLEQNWEQFRAKYAFFRVLYKADHRWMEIKIAKNIIPRFSSAKVLECELTYKGVKC